MQPDRSFCPRLSFLAGVLILSLTHSALSQLCNTRDVQPPPDNGLPTCSLDVEDYASGRAVPGSTNRSTPFPPWMNLTLARLGQAFAQNNLFSAGFNAFGGLVAGLPTPDEASVLAFTGNTASTSTAVQRYAATGAQLQVWMEDLFCTDTLDNAVLVSMGNVRHHHIKAAQAANAVGVPYVPSSIYDNVTTDDVMWAAVAADLAASNLTIRSWSSEYSQYDANTTAVNQFAQGLTLIAFMGYVITDPTAVFVWDATEDELEAYLHMWAVLGWILGIDDEYNVCLQPDVPTAAAYINALNEQYVYPSWFQIDKIGKVLVEAVVKNYNQYFPGLDQRVLMTIIMRDFFGIGVENLMGTLNLADELSLQQFDTTFTLSTQDPVERPLLNTALDTAVDAAVVAVLGPYVTYLQKAEYAFYPNVTGD